MTEKLKKVMADIFEIPEGTIDETTSQESLAEWTSLAHLRLITELEVNFGVNVSMEDALTLTSYPKLVQHLSARA